MEEQKDLPKPETSLPLPQNDLPLPEKEITSHSASAFQGETLEGYGKKFPFPKYIFLGIVFLILLVISTTVIFFISN
ncbi:MAG: hypothetical protein HYW63_04295 [Candidatus Levybacteria bacterium]|nr:hypothetical protein [Candidatus Levybacteria bacterium]